MGSKMMKPWHGTLKVYRSDCKKGLMFHLDMGLRGRPINIWSRELLANYQISRLYNQLREKGFEVRIDDPERMRIFTKTREHYAFLIEEVVESMNRDEFVNLSSQYFQE
jgi:hypothetical protein